MINNYEEQNILEFNIADEFFGIYITNILRIIEYSNIRKLPGMAGDCEGIIIFDNTIVPVINLSRILNVKYYHEGEKDKLVIVKKDKDLFAFHINYARKIIKLDDRMIFDDSKLSFVKLRFYENQKRNVYIIDDNELIKYFINKGADNDSDN